MPAVGEVAHTPGRAVLFDLDGTLLDTAPDLADALNRLRLSEGLDVLPFASIRPHVSHGSRALITLGFGLAPDSADFEPLRLRLLDIYHAHIATHSKVFDGIPEVLHDLAVRGLRWGIVTNKPGWLTEPLLAQVALPAAPGCVVSGDTLAVAKPDPAPLLLAATRLGVAPSACCYIGDAARDVEAGRRAGMRTFIARYGYLGPGDQPESWGADEMVDSPAALVPRLAHWLQSGN